MKKKKMFGILAVLVLALAGAFVAPAAAGTLFSVEASTYPVTEAETLEEQISGTVDISNISFSNSGATAQTVTIYELADDTNTVNSVATFVIPAVAGFYRPFGDQNYNDRITITNPCFRKSATATSIYVTGLYQ